MCSCYQGEHRWRRGTKWRNLSHHDRGRDANVKHNDTSDLQEYDNDYSRLSMRPPRRRLEDWGEAPPPLTTPLGVVIIYTDYIWHGFRLGPPKPPLKLAAIAQRTKQHTVRAGDRYGSELPTSRMETKVVLHLGAWREGTTRAQGEPDPMNSMTAARYS